MASPGVRMRRGAGNCSGRACVPDGHLPRGAPCCTSYEVKAEGSWGWRLRCAEWETRRGGPVGNQLSAPSSLVPLTSRCLVPSTCGYPVQLRFPCCIALINVFREAFFLHSGAASSESVVASLLYFNCPVQKRSSFVSMEVLPPPSPHSS